MKTKKNGFPDLKAQLALSRAVDFSFPFVAENPLLAALIIFGGRGHCSTGFFVMSVEMLLAYG